MWGEIFTISLPPGRKPYFLRLWALRALRAIIISLFLRATYFTEKQPYPFSRFRESLPTSLTTPFACLVHSELLVRSHLTRIGLLVHPITVTLRALDPILQTRFSLCQIFFSEPRLICSWRNSLFHSPPTDFRSGLAGLGCIACCAFSFSCFFSMTFSRSFNCCFMGGSSRSSKDSLSIA